MTVDALGFCLGIGRAHASLSLRLEEDLGAFHGLNFGDFTLLHGLLGADHGRMPMPELNPSAGRLPTSFCPHHKNKEIRHVA